MLPHYCLFWKNFFFLRCSENIGLLGLTKVGSRRVIQISTGFMIFFSIFGNLLFFIWFPRENLQLFRSNCEVRFFAGKFGAFFASIPLPIFAAIYCILFGIVAAVGVSFMQFANKNSMRNIYIIGLSLFLGISVPQYFNGYTSSAGGHGPARTNAGWVFEDSPFKSVTFSACITHLPTACVKFSACHIKYAVGL